MPLSAPDATLLDRAIVRAGSKAALAKRLGYTGPALNYWAKHGPPAKVRPALERLVQGDVTEDAVRQKIDVVMALVREDRAEPATAPAAPAEPVSPTQRMTAALQSAYDFFNRELFEGRLPPCVITLQRKGRTYGYYARERFGTRSRETTEDEIALNPSQFANRTDEEILATLGHEMVHLQHYRLFPETASRAGYHNKEWGRLMRRIGLEPSHTGQPGGRATGQQMTHWVVPGGPFARAAQALQATGWHVPYIDIDAEDDAKRRAAGRASKTRYTCPACAMNVWGKPTVKVICGECMLPMAAEQRAD